MQSIVTMYAIYCCFIRTTCKDQREVHVHSACHCDQQYGTMTHVYSHVQLPEGKETVQTALVKNMDSQGFLLSEVEASALQQSMGFS